MPVWLPVAAPENPDRRIDQGDTPVTADELREVAESYDRAWRPASVIAGYNPDTGQAGPSHWEGQYMPEVAPILAYQFNEGSQELEAQIEPNDRFRQLFEKGFRTPSIRTVRFPDHPSGEPKHYGQHVAMTGPGEIEIIAGLGGDRWAERMRSLQEQLEVDGRYGRFRTLQPEEISMPDTEKATPDGEAKKEAKPDQATLPGTGAEEGRERSASGKDKPKKKERTKLREAKKDPAAERAAQQDERIRSLSETVAELAGTVRTWTEAAGDPEKIRANAKASEEALDRIRARDEKDRVDSLQSRVRALAEGDAPRLRTADAEEWADVLALLPADKAEEKLEKLRAAEPIAEGLGKPFVDPQVFDNLPETFDVERYRNTNGQVPGASQLVQLAELTAAGKGDAVKAAIARERAERTRRAYHG